MSPQELREFEMHSQDHTKAAQATANGIYNFACALFESLEHRRLISGNGHHMAQELAEIAKQMVLKRQWSH